MHAKGLDQLVAKLAAGDSPGAVRYLSHFPKADRRPTFVRRALMARVHPEVMEVFERLAPWLTEQEADDAAARIRAALDSAGKAGMMKSELVRLFRDERGEVQALMDRLVRAREVVVTMAAPNGRSTRVYVLGKHAGGIRPLNEMDDPFADRSHLA